MQEKKRLSILLEKYITNSISDDEQAALFSLIEKGEQDDLMEEHLSQQFYAKDVPGADMSPDKAHVLMQKILGAEKENSRLLPIVNPLRKFLRFEIAAVVMVILLTTVFLLTKRTNSLAVIRESTIAAHGMRENANQSSNILQLRLEDSSIVLLQPGAVLRYPEHFESGKREVFLEGEAFFSVAKNVNRPFYVFCNDVVTHVLGTSFRVKPDSLKKQVEVIVRTGRVQVYENNPKISDRKKMNGVILTPNQKVIYSKEQRQFTASLVTNPMPIIKETLAESEPIISFVYEDIPMQTVISALERTYGIEMVIGNEALYNCLFTGDISKQDLFTKLDIVCQSVKASYQVAGTRILIEGKGCN